MKTQRITPRLWTELEQEEEKTKHETVAAELPASTYLAVPVLARRRRIEIARVDVHPRGGGPAVLVDEALLRPPEVTLGRRVRAQVHDHVGAGDPGRPVLARDGKARAGLQSPPARRSSSVAVFSHFAKLP